jgi:hypothetical protein
VEIAHNHCSVQGSACSHATVLDANGLTIAQSDAATESRAGYALLASCARQLEPASKDSPVVVIETKHAYVAFHCNSCPQDCFPVTQSYKPHLPTMSIMSPCIRDDEHNEAVK